MWRYVSSIFTVSLTSPSSSDPSTLSKALALATGDFGEVGRSISEALFANPLWLVAFPIIIQAIKPYKT